MPSGAKRHRTSDGFFEMQSDMTGWEMSEIRRRLNHTRGRLVPRHMAYFHVFYSATSVTGMVQALSHQLRSLSGIGIVITGKNDGSD